jgi:hypothetical protein
MNMQLTISLKGDRAVAETAELRDWLHNARIREVERVIQEESPPKRGEQGPTLLAVLTVVLGSRALVELVRSVFRCIEARTPKTKITITAGKKSITIDCVNPPPLAELVEQAKILATA